MLTRHYSPFPGILGSKPHSKQKRKTPGVEKYFGGKKSCQLTFDKFLFSCQQQQQQRRRQRRRRRRRRRQRQQLSRVAILFRHLVNLTVKTVFLEKKNSISNDHKVFLWKLLQLFTINMNSCDLNFLGISTYLKKERKNI